MGIPYSDWVRRYMEAQGWGQPGTQPRDTFENSQSGPGPESVGAPGTEMPQPNEPDPNVMGMQPAVSSPDVELAKLSGELGQYAQYGLGGDWLRRAFYTATAPMSRQALERERAVGEQQALAGFQGSGFHQRLLDSIEHQRRLALQRAWAGIRSQNEAVKQSAARALSDLNEFYNRLRAQGQFDDQAFRDRIELIKERWRREQDAATKQFWSNLLRSSLELGGRMLPFLMGG